MVKFAEKVLGRCAQLGAGMMVKEGGKMRYHQHECNYYSGHEGHEHQCFCGYRWVSPPQEK